MRGRAACDSGDPVKTVGLTLSTVVSEEVNVGLWRIHHVEVFLESLLTAASCRRGGEGRVFEPERCHKLEVQRLLNLLLSF